MIPVVTPEQMRRIDAGAVEPLEVLIERAGWAVASTARRMLGGTYGRRIAVLVGKGNNGADGRVAARVLERWGARCAIHRAEELPTALPARGRRPIDLVIDACYGTGFRGTFEAPQSDAPVLAVDIPSGVDGLTGGVSGTPLRASETITFVAPKPGLLLHPGAAFVGRLTVADVGLRIPPSESIDRFWLDESEAAAAWPRRPTTAHKWASSVWVIGGSQGMEGAPQLAALGAARAGAGYVRLSIPGRGSAASSPMEVVGHPLGSEWAEDVLPRRGTVRSVGAGSGFGDRRTPARTSRHRGRALARRPGRRRWRSARLGSRRSGSLRVAVPRHPAGVDASRGRVRSHGWATLGPHGIGRIDGGRGVGRRVAEGADDAGFVARRHHDLQHLRGCQVGRSRFGRCAGRHHRCRARARPRTRKRGVACCKRPWIGREKRSRGRSHSQ